MKLTLKVTFTDGEEFTTMTSPAVLMRWEEKTKRNVSDLSAGMGITDLLFWAHQCALRDKPRTIPLDLKVFAEQVDNIEVIDTSAENPSNGAQ